MTITVNQSPNSVSSGGSPETYHGQTGGNVAGPVYRNKHTYCHIQGHVQGAGSSQHQPYGSVVVANGSGVQYPAHMNIPSGQYSGPNAGFVPPYAGGLQGQQHHPCYYYQGPNCGWPNTQGPVHHHYRYQGYTSPPSSPPQPQVQYGYPVLAPRHEHNSPIPTYHNNHNHNHHSNNRRSNNSNNHCVPCLDHRRNSWSSSGATDTPTTPFPVAVDPVPAIVGDAGVIDDRIKEIGKTVEMLVLNGPPLPRPIPASYPPVAPIISNSLDNPTNTTNVYIRGLPPDMDDDKLYEMTCRFGAVVSHKAIMDTEHGTCKGYGFARYGSIQEAENCIRGLVSQKYEVGFACESFNARLKTLADPNSTNIYVSNLPCNMTEKDMQDIFAGYVVISNRILRDSHGVSRGVGFARFESREICNEVIRTFHGIPVGEEALALQVRYADTSAQKRLKATTTKKRQYRSNEYNSVVSGSHCNNRSHVPYGGQNPHFRHRVLLRQSSMGSSSSGDAGVNPNPRDSHSSSTNRKNWVRSQDWKGISDENKPADWRDPGNATTDLSKLETVHEDDGDTVSEAHSEGTTSGHDYGQLSHAGRTSSGSASDPGDSYGGREYRKDGGFICKTG